MSKAKDIAEKIAHGVFDERKPLGQVLSELKTPEPTPAEWAAAFAKLYCYPNVDLAELARLKAAELENRALVNVISGIHGALADAATVRLPASYTDDHAPAIRQLTAERDTEKHLRKQLEIIEHQLREQLAAAREDQERACHGIYVASRVSRAPMWQVFRASGVPIVSSWIDEAEEGQTENLSELWSRIFREIMGCQAVVFYAHADDAPWKGAFVECGAALAMGKPVMAVVLGDVEPRNFRPIGSWLNHPNVRIFGSVQEAITAAIAAGKEKGDGKS